MATSQAVTSITAAAPTGALSHQTPAVEFLKFPDLPIELRFDIYDWIVGSAPGRVVELRWDIKLERTFTITPLPADISALRKTCRETASQVDITFPLAFAVSERSPRPIPASIRFNFAIDTLYVRHEPPGLPVDHFRCFGRAAKLLTVLEGSELNQIRSLALDLRCFMRKEDYNISSQELVNLAADSWDVLPLFRNLESLHLVIDYHDQKKAKNRWTSPCHRSGFVDTCSTCIVFKQDQASREAIFKDDNLEAKLSILKEQLQMEELIEETKSSDPSFVPPSSIDCWEKWHSVDRMF